MWSHAGPRSQSTAAGEMRTHLVCWLVPACAIAAALAAGQLGYREDLSNCSLRDSRWAMCYEGAGTAGPR